LDELVRAALAGRRCDPTAVERVLFALVANRALDPGAKLACTRWVDEVAHVPGPGRWICCSRSRAPWQVDLILFDTGSTYFERDTADEPVARDAHGQPVDGATED
jgi:hypothetical protein